ncbi:glycoside hydrolase family 18 protein [Amanita thiersii Skay4041]|uniref:Glycoside hydrolase family 18 protein n=1 Tax=Amanita thiersii Skay4041 TaxID=703135 RepID=A0A2A9NM40_9AGAR|nr:glycoside hydrolase family 18 protein [Amanita thiersii Skay4041]
MPPVVVINKHTTHSTPRPHILYSVQVVLEDKRYVVNRRYSEHIFIILVEALKDQFSLPPKRILTTTLFPSAWADDTLIAERKAGLAAYLSQLLETPEYQRNRKLLDFLSASHGTGGQVDLEDALPSTLSRKALKDFKLEGEVNAEATTIAAAYYPDWSAEQHPPESLDFSKFDILFFAFVVPNSSSTINWDSGSQSILKRLVTSAHNSGKGTKIVLSVGGWGGSHYFSQACSTAANRSTFTNALVNAVKTFGLDGVDIDWEYPNSEGAGNPHSSADAANLLSLFKSLRSALGSSKIISAAVPHLPWLGSDGRPLKDVSAYAAQMTYLNIMNYDVWGASASPGPNAPLGNLCGTSTQPQASAQAGLAQWKAAGFPASKMLLGLALYGYVSKSTKTHLTGSLLPSSEMVLLQREQSTDLEGDKKMHFLNGAHARSKEAVKDQAAAANLQSWWGQQIPFKSIVTAGALAKGSDGSYREGGGFTMGWDDCSDTPFLFNTAQSTVVTYDDTWSLADKATFAKQNGMAGCFTWSLDQDDGLTLQNAIRKGLGK